MAVRPQRRWRVGTATRVPPGAVYQQRLQEGPTAEMARQRVTKLVAAQGVSLKDTQTEVEGYQGKLLDDGDDCSQSIAYR